jgi:hypothetical protein
MTGFTTWAGRVIAAIFAIGCVRWIVIAVREKFQHAASQHRRIVEEEAPRPAAGLRCLWCHPTPAGRAGRCGCTGKCEDVDWCIGDYTTLSGPEFTAQLEEMLGEGGQR